MHLKTIFKIFIDLSIVGLSWFFAYIIRFDATLEGYYSSQITDTLPFVILSYLFIANLSKVYRHIWHYSSLKEVLVISLVSIINSILILFVRYFEIVIIPYSVIVINIILSILALAFTRALRRFQYLISKDKKSINGTKFNVIDSIIIGAGDTAFELLRDIELKSYKYWNVIGLLDDNPEKFKSTILGYKVIGNTTALETVILKNNIKLIIIAMPSAKLEEIKSIYRRCKNLGVEVKIIPSIHDRIKQYGKVFESNFITLNDLKDIDEIEHTLFPSINFPQRNKSVLITGGAGYIGSHLIKIFLENGYNVTILDNFTYGELGISNFKKHKNFKVINGDIANIRDVSSAVKGCDIVVALAAIVGDPACGLDAEETLNLNYESTKILVEACNFYGVSRFVFASSCSVYGAGGESIHDENSPTNPVSLYARTRIFSENFILENCHEDTTPVILRLSTVFGYSDRMRYDLVVNTLTANGVINKSINVFGGNQWRPFIHCKDAALAFYSAATFEESSKLNKQIFNVGSENLNYTINQVADIVADEISDVSLNIDDQIIDARDYKVSFEKIKSTLGLMKN